MKTIKIVLISGIIGLGSYIFGAFNVIDDNAILGGGNLPDRCEFYDQAASRSVKDVVKGSAGKLYSYRVVSTASTLKYFQLHDTASGRGTTANLVYSTPLDTTAASATPKVVEEKFAVPMDFPSGIRFTVSTAFGTTATSSDQDVKNSYFISLCYY